MPCLGIPAGPGQNTYHQFPFISAFGGYVFGFEGGSFDPGDIGLDSNGAIEGAEFIDALYRGGYASGSLDYLTMADLFNQGRIPFMWTGPWQVRSVQDAGIDYGVAKLPLMDGNTPAPFVGSQGFFVNARSENQVLAQTFLLDYLATVDTMLRLFEVGDRPPALVAAFDQVSGDPDVAAFAASGADGMPVPNIPEMLRVWEALDGAIGVINNGTYGEEVTDNLGNTATNPADAAAAMEAAAERIRASLAGG